MLCVTQSCSPPATANRFVNGTRHSKLLEPVLGVPLIVRTLDSALGRGLRTCMSCSDTRRNGCEPRLNSVPCGDS